MTFSTPTGVSTPNPLDGVKECYRDVTTVGLTTYRSPGVQKSGDLGLETLLTIKGTKKQEGTLVAISQPVLLTTEFAQRGRLSVVN